MVYNYFISRTAVAVAMGTSIWPLGRAANPAAAAALPSADCTVAEEGEAAAAVTTVLFLAPLAVRIPLLPPQLPLLAAGAATHRLVTAAQDCFLLTTAAITESAKSGS